MKKFMKVVMGAAVPALFFSFQNCSRGFSSASWRERSALGDNPFVVAGVKTGDGQPSENLRVASAQEALSHVLVDCSKPGVAEAEREAALAAAAADPAHLTIPVRFAISFGTQEDVLAYWAHKRAILSESNPGESYIPIGDAQDSMFSEAGGKYSAYYVVDHGSDSAGALRNYKYGTKCFYDTVKIKSLVQIPSSRPNYPFITQPEDGSGIQHKIKYMWYGWCSSSHAVCSQAGTAAYGNGTYNYGNDVYPNRLFGKWPHYEINHLSGKSEPQIVKLFVADLRDGQIRGQDIPAPAIRVPSNVDRGAELTMSASQFLDLKSMLRHRDQIVVNLSGDYKSASTGLVFRGMQGVPQVFSNVVRVNAAEYGAQTATGDEGTNLSGQYTPIVLDLGEQGVLTSGLFGGAFFNMMNVSDPTIAGVASYEQPHATAWLGGRVLDVGGASSAFSHDFRRVSEDGFLVIPDPDGQVRSSRNMFGDNTVVNGMTFPNGFLALQALAQKDCASPDPKRRYLGPWDGTLYSSTLKVWIDRNRNGSADAGEVRSLREVGVVAINACNVVSREAFDSYGNGTALRSAFLYQQGEDITENMSEIIQRLKTGRTGSGAAAQFRLAIDVIFKVDISRNLFSPGVQMPRPHF